MVGPSPGKYLRRTTIHCWFVGHCLGTNLRASQVVKHVHAGAIDKLDLKLAISCIPFLSIS